LQRQDFPSLLRDLAAHAFNFTPDEVDIRHVGHLENQDGSKQNENIESSGVVARLEILEH
jgi:hypothetical protein